MTQFHCDICSAEINRGDSETRWLRITHKALNVDVEVTGWKVDSTQVIDLCLTCARKIVAEGSEVQP